MANPRKSGRSARRPTPAADRPPADGPHADEAAVFRAAVSDVKPLRHTPRVAGQPKPKSRPRLRPAESMAVDLDAAMPLIADAGSSDIAGADEITFRRPGVRTQVVRRLRRGLIPIEAELDLHGLTQAAAREQLADFLDASLAAGLRCVRVIHGKGYRSGARGPVLKVAVDGWLRRHFDVMAFTSARAVDGGTGAVYVLLRA